MYHDAKVMTQIMEAEVFDPGPIEQIFETSFHTLPVTFSALFWRKDPIIVLRGDEANIVTLGLRHEPPQLADKFGRHRDVTYLSTLELRPYRQ